MTFWELKMKLKNACTCWSILVFSLHKNLTMSDNNHISYKYTEIFYHLNKSCGNVFILIITNKVRFSLFWNSIYGESFLYSFFRLGIKHV